MSNHCDQPRGEQNGCGNGSKTICRVSNVLRSPSPDPGHYDFMKGHKLLDPGSRFAVAKLQHVDGRLGELIGDPYRGSSVTEKTILDQLQRVAATLDEVEK